MKLKLGAIVDSSIHIKKIFEANVVGSVAFTIKRNITAINVILTDFEESRKKLIEKYADKDEAGQPAITNNQYTFTKNFADFGTEMNSLLNTEVDIEIKQIPSSALEKAEVSAHTLTACDFMITE